MQILSKHIILFFTAALLFAGCSDESMEQYAGVPISIDVTRAGESEGKNERKYNLMFWTGNNNSIPANGSWFYCFIEKTDIGGPFYFTENENGANPKYYPHDNSPIWGVGYLPADKDPVTKEDSLIVTNDYNTLTINKKLLPAGFFDVCSTSVIEGRASSPFNNDDKRFDFKHTLVKLNFTAVKTINVNARVSRIYITLKGSGIRDTWTYHPTNGYEPQPTTAYGDLVFTSGTTPSDEDFDIKYIKEEDIPTTGGINEWAEGKELFFEYHKTETGNTGGSDESGGTVQTDETTGRALPERLKTCYIAHDADNTFIYDKTKSQAYIRLYNLKARLTKQGIAGAVDIKNLPQQVDIPLTNMNGDPWKDPVKAGDAFKIYIVFDQNKIRLYGQKMPWNLGGRLYIPMNPNDGETVTTET